MGLSGFWVFSEKDSRNFRRCATSLLVALKVSRSVGVAAAERAELDLAGRCDWGRVSVYSDTTLDFFCRPRDSFSGELDEYRAMSSNLVAMALTLLGLRSSFPLLDPLTELEETGEGRVPTSSVATGGGCFLNDIGSELSLEGRPLP
jgi:hypothetical protein